MNGNFKNICRKIVAVGRNYREHAKELNNPIPKSPIIFIKPSSSIIFEGEKIQIPKNSTEIHHEVELGVVIGRNISRISVDKVSEYISGYVLALDMTDRNLQEQLKQNRHPWALAKCFDTSCPLSSFISKDAIKDPMDLTLKLFVNGKERQNGRTSDMIWNPSELISFISETITLNEGDIVLTGTPGGVGPVVKGDKIVAEIENVMKMEFNVE